MASQTAAWTASARADDRPMMPFSAPMQTSGDVDLVTGEVQQALGASWAAVLEHDGDANAVIGRAGPVPDSAWIVQACGPAADLTGPAWIDAQGSDGAVLLLPVRDPETGDRRLLAAGFSAEAVERGRAVAPILVRFLASAVALVLRLSRRLKTEQRLRLGMHDALDHSHLAVLVFDKDGRVQFQNRAARSLLAQRQGIRISGSTVAPTALSDAIRFQVTLEHMLERSRAGISAAGPAAQVMLLDRGPDKRPLVATLTQTDHRASEPGDAAAILYLVKPEQDLSPLLFSLCHLHKLSPAETRLVHELVGGRTLAEAAKTMHVSEHTARAYLKQAFVKTGTNRQAELIRLMLMSLLPLPENIVTAANG